MMGVDVETAGSEPALSAAEPVPDFWDVEEAREKKLATVVAPDNGTTAEVLSAVLECAEAWVPEARIIGNVRAGDIARAVRSALSAQVQDVAGLLDETWNAAVEKAAAIANDCVHLTPDPGTAIRTMLNGRTKLHPAAPAKQEG